MVYSQALTILPKHMHFLIVSQDTNKIYWPVVGKFHIRDLQEEGLDVKKFRGYYFVEINSYINRKNDKYYLEFLKLHHDRIYDFMPTILRENKVYILDVSNDEKVLEFKEYNGPIFK